MKVFTVHFGSSVLSMFCLSLFHTLFSEESLSHWQWCWRLSYAERNTCVFPQNFLHIDGSSSIVSFCLLSRYAFKLSVFFFLGKCMFISLSNFRIHLISYKFGENIPNAFPFLFLHLFFVIFVRFIFFFVMHWTGIENGKVSGDILSVKKMCCEVKQNIL